MKQRSRGMILLTTLALLAVVTCMWLSSMHLLLVFKKMTYHLQERQVSLKTLEEQVNAFIEGQSAARFERCIEKACLLSGVTFRVEKLKCYPCLVFEMNGDYFGSQHWLVRAEFQGQKLSVRWATPKMCGACQEEVELLHSSVLSWIL